MGHEPTEKTDLRDYLRPILKRWWLILAVVPVVTVGTYFYYDSKPKTYAAVTNLYVQPSALSDLLLEKRGSGIATGTIENFAILIQTRAVGEEAAALLAKGKAQSASLPSGSVDAAGVEGTSFISLTGFSSTPKGAARLANAYARAFINIQAAQLRTEANRTLKTAKRQLSGLTVTDTSGEIRRAALEEKIQTLQLVATQKGAVGIRQVEPAVASSIPVNHDPKSNAVFAFVISLMLAVGGAFGLEYLTRKITSVEDAEDIFHAPILTEVPKVDVPARSEGEAITIQGELHEPFRRLQMNLDMLAEERPLRTILIASAAPVEGKSTVARNLALAFREAGRNVAVLDADFRRATLGGLLAAREGPGLTDILAGRASFGQAVQEVLVPTVQNGNGSLAPYAASAPQGQGSPKNGDLAMVPAGSHHSELAALLASGGMRQMLTTATNVYDRVVIDSSPILAASDVLPLLGEVDGVLLVTRVGMSTRDSTRRLLRELRRVSNTHVIGVVVNGIPPRTYRARAYGYYYG